MVLDCSNILIVGKGAVASALAKKLIQYSDVENIYITSPTQDYDFCTSVDIRENDVNGLLKFALENDIDLTIPISYKSLNSDIVSFFQSNGQNIFGPDKKCYSVFNNTISCKKFLYKIHAQTAKFGFFNKLQNALDYIKQTAYPIIVSTLNPSSLIGDDRFVVSTVSLAARILEELFVNKSEQEVLIENFTNGKDFTIYYITDGYSVLPITSVQNYKFYKDGDRGFYTDGCGAICPDYRISEVIYERVGTIVKNILLNFEKKGNPYIGILGIEGVLTTEDRFYVSDIKPFLQNHDARAVLNIVEEDILRLFNSCVNGSFSDEYQQIRTNNLSSVSVSVFSEKSENEIKGLDKIEDSESIDYFSNIEQTAKSALGHNFTLTHSNSTISRARKNVYEDLTQISFEGMHYRKDI